MNTKVINIYGAGMAGLIAANILSRNFNVKLFEKKDKLEKNHFALLRFRDNLIEEYTYIKCKKVNVKKSIFFENKLFNESNILFDNLYSRKVTGSISTRSIGDLTGGIRYIPPDDFYDQLVQNVNASIMLECDKKFTNENLQNEFCINTTPMSNTYQLVSDKNLAFYHQPITILTFKIEECDVYQTIYFPAMDENNPAYRISINGNRIICEIANICVSLTEQLNVKKQILNAFGINILSPEFEPELKSQKYGKILNIDEDTRQSVIYNLTQKCKIFSLGRFACWRNSVMLSDVVNDVLKIKKWIIQRDKIFNKYEQQKSM
jgi:hypothetical protein